MAAQHVSVADPAFGRHQGHPRLYPRLAALLGRASACLRGVSEPRLIAATQQALGALERAALLVESGMDVSGDYLGLVRVWDLATGTCRYSLAVHSAESVAVSADGGLAVSGT